MKVPFYRANILVPQNIDMYKWSVVACDQYTSEPDYWKRVKEIVGDSPSTLNLTLPEVFLEEGDVEKRIKNINHNMESLLNKNIFQEYKDSLIYIERKQNDGRIREGIIGMVDLEDYSFEEGSQTLIRATEKTVLERIPPRVKVRENASLELPHIMILIDDDKKEIIENIKKDVTEKIYDFDLMQKGGHIKGYIVPDLTANRVLKQLEHLADKKTFEEKYNVKNRGVLLFAVGDGNHSLATAKTCYENLKRTLSEKEYLSHPARYALVEIVNLHSDALSFEAIHRVLFDVEVEDLLKELKKYYKMNEEGNGQKFKLITKDVEKTFYIENPKSNIAVGSIQVFLDEYLKTHKGKIDYVHSEEIVRELSKEENNLGILLDSMKKEELFKTVIVDGALPRKTFSMGHGHDKRFYLEARKIK